MAVAVGDGVVEAGGCLAFLVDERRWRELDLFAAEHDGLPAAVVGLGDRHHGQRVAIGVDIVRGDIDDHRSADDDLVGVGSDHGGTVRFDVVDHADQHRAAHDVTVAVIDAVGEWRQCCSTGAGGDGELLSLDHDLDSGGQRFDHRQCQGVAVGIGVVHEHRHRGGHVASQAYGVGANQRRTVGVADASDFDAHFDIFADRFECVEGSVREDRRALEAVGRGETQRRETRWADRLGHLTQGGLSNGLRWREPADTQGVALGVDVVEEHVDGHRNTRAGLRRVGHPDGRFVGRAGREQFDDHGRRVDCAVAVDDRVLELIDTDVAGFWCVDDGGRRADVDRPVSGDADRRHGDRFAVGVVVVGGHLYRHRGA